MLALGYPVVFKKSLSCFKETEMLGAWPLCCPPAFSEIFRLILFLVVLLAVYNLCRERFWQFGPEGHEEDILDWRLAKHLPIIVLNHNNNIIRKWLIVFDSKQHVDEGSLQK